MGRRRLCIQWNLGVQNATAGSESLLRDGPAGRTMFRRANYPTARPRSRRPISLSVYVFAGSRRVVAEHRRLQRICIVGSKRVTAACGARYIASTNEVNAIENTSTQPDVEHVPIYRVDGGLVANDYIRLWSDDFGNLGNINVDEFGNTPPEFQNDGVNVWTATTATGQPAFMDEGLGHSRTGQGLVGRAEETGQIWMTYSSRRLVTELPFYAVSGTLTVPVPEPSGVVLAVCSALLLVARRSLLGTGWN